MSRVLIKHLRRRYNSDTLQICLTYHADDLQVSRGYVACMTQIRCWYHSETTQLWIRCNVDMMQTGQRNKCDTTREWLTRMQITYRCVLHSIQIRQTYNDSYAMHESHKCNAYTTRIWPRYATDTTQIRYRYGSETIQIRCREVSFTMQIRQRLIKEIRKRYDSDATQTRHRLVPDRIEMCQHSKAC